MIAGISGKLVGIGLTEALVENHGIRYRILIPMSTYDRMPREGEEVSLLTYLLVREDELTGFATEKEKKLFELLLTVSGIGPKIALNILSNTPFESFCRSVMNADIKALSRINGIGKKSAERLVVELRDKVRKLSPELSFEKGDVSTAVASAAEDAILALERLGFKVESVQKIVHEIVKGIPETECTSERLIRAALAALNQ
jgi:Holliday junction DNA helicase RuvA